MPEHGEKEQRSDGDRTELERTPTGVTATPEKAAANGQSADAATKRLANGPAAGGPPSGSALPNVPPPAPHRFASGTFGVLREPTDTPFGQFPKGTTVQVMQQLDGDQLLCLVWSNNQAGHQVPIPIEAFLAEPSVGHRVDELHHETELQDHPYSDFTSLLWHGAPRASDVAQGGLEDCYLMAGIGAVAAANPKAVMDLFSPHTPNQKSYQVSLYLPDAQKKLTRHTVRVDTSLPSVGKRPAYALAERKVSAHQAPLWPALIEKAYAQLMGGYTAIGDEGGMLTTAMSMLTGIEAKAEAIPAQGKDVVQRFRRLHAEGKAVACGSLDHKEVAWKKGEFNGNAPGPYWAVFTSDQGQVPEIVKGTFFVGWLNPQTGELINANDQSKDGKLTGHHSGTVGEIDYDSASVEVTFPQDKAPAQAKDLEVKYQWRGLIDKPLHVYAWHGYIFQSVTSDGKIVLKNPWGNEHPKPMTGDDFLRLFEEITTDEVPVRGKAKK